LSNKAGHPVASDPMAARRDRCLRIAWLGQTAASLCWIASVIAYGVTSAGDYFQLFAASAWLLANIAVAVPGQDS